MPMPQFRRRPLVRPVLLVVAFAAGVLLERGAWVPGAVYRQPAGLERVFGPFWETWRLAERHFVERGAIEPVPMTRGAIEGLLASLGDEGHTTYISPDDYRQLKSGLKGEVEGIGARLTLRRRRPTIVHTMPDSPARAAGLKAGDVLLEVDGKAVAEMRLDRIVQLVRGAPGTAVRLRLLRGDQTLDLDITRAKVQLRDVSWRMLPGAPVAHVALAEFVANTDKQLRAALAEARAAGARAVVLDLRANQGGLKAQAVAVTSELIAQGAVLIEQDASGNRQEIPVTGKGSATDVPLVLIVDEGTASAAEILAGAVQDHRRGRVVGTKTYGTGTVLQPFPLSDGSAVLLAVAEWFTPAGRQIWKKGVTPDVEVPLADDGVIEWPDADEPADALALARSSDKQLLKAFEMAKQAAGLK